ncbi:MAG TPA: hypothetical protein V6C84_19025 [Coleofasciculaceae cyanobacterium]|jgi:hypothetical protein
MPNEPIRPLISAFQSQAELELLHMILQSSNSCYPCNPAEPEAEAYFAALEQEVFRTGWTEEDFAAPAQRLATQFDQLWAIAPVADTASQILNTEFLQRFTTQVPHQVLSNIVQRAQQIITSNLSLADQLVHAVQDCLPSWGEEDLQVLARPFAYAMRGSETEALEVVLRSVRCAEWKDLSSIEQARLSLAIARYAIDQTATDQN